MNKLYIYFIVFSLTYLPAVMAAPVVDGRLSASDGYTFVQEVELSGDKGSGTANLYYTSEGGFVYGLLETPTSYVDNSYGDNSVGWDKEHKFKELLGSDKTQITVLDGSGNGSGNFEIDYLERDKNATDPSKEFYTEWDGDHIVDAATSLEYNSVMYNQFLEGDGTDPIGDKMNSPETAGPNSYDILDPAFSDWIFSVNYEFKLDASGLNNGFSGFLIDKFHASPSKFKIKNIYHKPPVEVPEPTTYAMMGGLLMAIYFCRKQKVVDQAA